MNRNERWSWSMLLGCLVLARWVMGCSGPVGPSVVIEELSKDESGKPGSALSLIRKASPEEVVASVDPSTGVVTFSYRLEGSLVPYDRQYSGEVIARREGEQGAGRFHLFLERGKAEPAVELGYLDGGALQICGRYEIDGVARELPCDALFLHSPEHPRPLADGSYPFRFPVILGLGASATARGSASGAIDLHELALPQINQYGTGTCYFNSTAGILEWFYRMSTGRALDVSEPALVGALANGELGPIDDHNLVEKTRALSGVVPDALMPVLDYFTPYAGFDEVEGQASQSLQRLPDSDRVTLPFALKGEPLFWYGRWQSGHTTEADYQRVTDFLARYRRPIHLQHVVSGYWHAVILLGHNPRTGEVLIKDSLGNTNLTATWRSKQWFLQTSYGAVGITEEGQAQPPQPEPLDPDAISIHAATAPWSADPRWTVLSFTLDGDADALSRVAAVRYRVEGSTLDRTVESIDNRFLFRIRTTLDQVALQAELLLSDGQRFQRRVVFELADPEPRPLTAADFRIGVGYEGSGVDGYQGFSLHLNASPAALAAVDRVVYSIHPTFGAYRTFTAADADSGFATTRYLTYARDWTTEGTEIVLKDGRGLDLPGTRIRW